MFVCLVVFLFATTRQLKLNHMYLGQIVYIIQIGLLISAIQII